MNDGGWDMRPSGWDMEDALRWIWDVGFWKKAVGRNAAAFLLDCLMQNPSHFVETANFRFPPSL